MAFSEKSLQSARVMSLITYEIEFVEAHTKLETRALCYDFFIIVFLFLSVIDFFKEYLKCIENPSYLQVKLCGHRRPKIGFPEKS